MYCACASVTAPPLEPRLAGNMHALDFSIAAIAFTFEIKLIGGNNHNREIIVITSDVSSRAYVSSSRLAYKCLCMALWISVLCLCFRMCV